MENTRSIIEKLNTYEINKGKIVKRWEILYSHGKTLAYFPR